MAVLVPCALPSSRATGHEGNGGEAVLLTQSCRTAEYGRMEHLGAHLSRARAAVRLLLRAGQGAPAGRCWLPWQC